MKHLGSIRLFALMLGFALWGSTLAAQTLAERARTEVPTCAPVDNAYNLCLVAEQIVANSEILFLSHQNGSAVFGMKNGSSIVVHVAKEELAITTYPNAFLTHPKAHETLTDLGQLSPEDYGSFSFSAPTAGTDVLSPQVVSLLDFGGYDLFVYSIFLNSLQTKDATKLSRAQRAEHMLVISALLPLKTAENE